MDKTKASDKNSSHSDSNKQQNTKFIAAVFGGSGAVGKVHLLLFKSRDLHVDCNEPFFIHI
jgi:hypothetical protein